MPLALNDTAYQVGIVPGDFEDESSELEQIASLLSTSTDSIKNKLDADWVQEDFLVPITVIASSKEDLYNQLKEIPAVSINETTGRIYPLGPAAAHITGYI